VFFRKSVVPRTNPRKYEQLLSAIGDYVEANSDCYFKMKRKIREEEIVDNETKVDLVEEEFTLYPGLMLAVFEKKKKRIPYW